MTLRTINTIILYLSATLIFISLAFNVFLYLYIKPPVFNTLVSARILGSDDRNIFVEMTLDIDNVCGVPFEITGTQLYFYDNVAAMSQSPTEERIARVYSLENIIVSAFSNTIIKINATISKATFERLMSNAIDQYSFHLVGHLQTNIFFFPKYLKVNKYIPVDVNSLVTRFITDAFKNSVSIDNIRFFSERENDFMVCNMTFYNRAGLDIYIRNFEANVEVNRTHTGDIDFFEPFRFRHYETQRTSNVRFIFPPSENPLTGIGNYRYRINGRLLVELWQKHYHFPVELIGEY